MNKSQEQNDEVFNVIGSLMRDDSYLEKSLFDALCAQLEDARKEATGNDEFPAFVHLFSVVRGNRAIAFEILMMDNRDYELFSKGEASEE